MRFPLVSSISVTCRNMFVLQLLSSRDIGRRSPFGADLFSLGCIALEIILLEVYIDLRLTINARVLTTCLSA